MYYNNSHLYSRLVTRLFTDPESEIAIYTLYQHYRLECVDSGKEEAITKHSFGRLFTELYPNVAKVHSRTKERTSVTKYRGLRLKDMSIDEDDVFDAQTVVMSLPTSSTVTQQNNTSVHVAFDSGLLSNGNVLYKNVIFHEDGQWSLSISGVKINLGLYHVNNIYGCNQKSISDVCVIVQRLRLCQGVEAKKVHMNDKVIVDFWTKSGDENYGKRSVRSSKCPRVLKLGSIASFCRVCRQVPHNNPLPPINQSTPEATPNRTGLSKADIQRLVPNASESLIDFILTQLLIANNTNAKSNRWPKAVLQSCMTLWTRSPQAYRDLKSSGMMILPSESILKLYKNCISQSSGFSDEVFEWMANEADRLNIPADGRMGGIIIDEMSIQADITVVHKGSSLELVGFVERMTESKSIKIIQDGSEKQEVAQHVFQFVFLGFGGFRFPFAHFPVTEASAAEIHCMFWEAVSQLSAWGFVCKYVNMDGANANRSFMKMNLEPADNMKTMAATSEVDPNQKVIFMMDYSHGIKKIRNNLIKSVKGCKSRLLTLLDDTVLVWHWWEDAYKWDKANPVQLHRKLTEAHIYPTNGEKMRNHLAEQVLDIDMLRLFVEFQASLGAYGVKLQGVIDMLIHTSKLIANFRDTRPLKLLSDNRLSDNKKALDWFETWEANLTRKSTAEKARCLMSYQCREDLRSCVIGFHELCVSHLTENPNSSIIPSRINSDVVENHFCQQRGLHSGNNTNPNYATYQKSVNSIILGQNTISRKSNSGGLKRSAAEPYAFNIPGPLRPSVKSMKYESHGDSIRF
jgi:hypothetical protein